MLCNLGFILLGVAGRIAALPISQFSTLTPSAEQFINTRNLQVKRDASEVTEVVQEEIVILVDGTGNPISTSTVLSPSVPIQTSPAQAQANQVNQTPPTAP